MDRYGRKPRDARRSIAWDVDGNGRKGAPLGKKMNRSPSAMEHTGEAEASPCVSSGGHT